MPETSIILDHLIPNTIFAKLIADYVHVIISLTQRVLDKQIHYSPYSKVKSTCKECVINDVDVDRQELT